MINPEQIKQNEVRIPAARFSFFSLYICCDNHFPSSIWLLESSLHVRTLILHMVVSYYRRGFTYWKKSVEQNSCSEAFFQSLSSFSLLFCSPTQTPHSSHTSPSASLCVHVRIRSNLARFAGLCCVYSRYRKHGSDMERFGMFTGAAGGWTNGGISTNSLYSPISCCKAAWEFEACKLICNTVLCGFYINTVGLAGNLHLSFVKCTAAFRLM